MMRPMSIFEDDGKPLLPSWQYITPEEAAHYIANDVRQKLGLPEIEPSNEEIARRCREREAAGEMFLLDSNPKGTPEPAQA